MRSKYFKYICVIVLFYTTNSWAQKDFYYTMNYSRARATGMGSAFTAMEGGLESSFYNPATFRFVDTQNRRINLSFIFSPFASYGIYDLKNNKLPNGNPEAGWWDIVKTLPKAIVLSTKNFEIGFVNHEELESRQYFHPHTRFLESNNFFQHHVENLVVRVRLAEQVHLGGSVQYYSVFKNDSLRHGFGSSYGVFLRPNPKLDFGIVFISLPGGLKNIRLDHDRFEHESVNIGISYHPFSSTTFALDLRNLTEEGQNTTREYHIGFEQSFLNHIYLRSGFYRIYTLKNNRMTLGIGLLNLDLLRFGNSKYSSPNLALNYAIMFDPGSGSDTRWHFFSFQLGIGW